MSDLKVGSTIYRRDGSTVIISAETKVSWIIGENSWNQHKIKKSAMRKGNSSEYWVQFFVSKQDALDCLYATNNRHKISNVVENCNDGQILRAVAELIGYKEAL